MQLNMAYRKDKINTRTLFSQQNSETLIHLTNSVLNYHKIWYIKIARAYADAYDWLRLSGFLANILIIHWRSQMAQHFTTSYLKKKKEETLQDMSSLYYSSKMKQNNFLQLQHIQLTFSIFNFCFHALKICRANICAVDSMYSKQTWFCHGSGRRNLWDERYYLWRTNYTSGWNCWPV